MLAVDVTKNFFLCRMISQITTDFLKVPRSAQFSYTVFFVGLSSRVDIFDIKIVRYSMINLSQLAFDLTYGDCTSLTCCVDCNIGHTNDLIVRNNNRDQTLLLTSERRYTFTALDYISINLHLTQVLILT